MLPLTSISMDSIITPNMPDLLTVLMQGLLYILPVNLDDTKYRVQD